MLQKLLLVDSFNFTQTVLHKVVKLLMILGQLQECEKNKKFTVKFQ